jgi:hypothetical protein
MGVGGISLRDRSERCQFHDQGGAFDAPSQPTAAQELGQRISRFPVPFQYRAGPSLRHGWGQQGQLQARLPGKQCQCTVERLSRDVKRHRGGNRDQAAAKRKGD